MEKNVITKIQSFWGCWWLKNYDNKTFKMYGEENFQMLILDIFR